MSKRRVVFLDRDGTLNRDVGYPGHFGQIHFYPAAADAVRKLKESGYAAVVITHQSGVGLGYFTEESLSDLHRQFAAALAGEGARLDGIYYCPHHPDSPDETYRRDCSCRKPRPGLLLRAASELNLDLEGCAMIGDKVDDILLGRSVGARSILVLTGYGKEARGILAESPRPPDFIADGILQAVDWVLGAGEGR